MRHGIGRLRAAASGSVDTDAAAWAAAVTGNGGAYSQATLGAVSNFVKAAKASSYWTKLNRINLFCGDQLAACLVPLKVGGGSATDTNVNFVGGDYTEATGLTGNGTTKYLDTGLSQDVFGAGDRHLSVYERVRSTIINRDMLACETAISTNVWSLMTAGLVTTTRYFSDAGLAGPQSTGNAVGGHWVGSQLSGVSSDIYKNGGGAVNAAVVAATPGAVSVAVFARKRLGGTIIQYADATLAGYSIGTGLTAGDIANFYTHMQAFQTALARNV